MKFPRLTTLFYRRVHKWLGLIIGLQFILWTVSGAMMALIETETAGKPMERAAVALPAKILGLRALGSEPVFGFALRPMNGGYVYELRTSRGVRMVDAASGRPVVVDARLARALAQAEYGDGRVDQVSRLASPSLETRDYDGPTWRVDFADDDRTTFYVAESDGRIVGRRNDAWRLRDIFWMLHNIDYVGRKSFNHPLIVMVAFAALWLAMTGIYLWFKSGRKPGTAQRAGVLRAA